MIGLLLCRQPAVEYACFDWVDSRQKKSSGGMMRRLGMVVVLVMCVGLCVGCERADTLIIQNTPTPTVLAQWAVAAEASSQFGFPDWSVTRVTGAPAVNACADDSRAWSSARGNGVEWLHLTYAQPVYATEVRIYQTLGRGAIFRVSLVTEDGTVQRVWEGEDTDRTCPGMLIVTVSQTAERIVGVNIDLDESRTGFWNQIDAVELIGVR